MKIVIAMDSFKGSLPSAEAGNAAAAGFLRADPAAEITVYPVADGGEGTTDTLVSGLHGQYRSITVSDPLGRPVRAKYGILPDRTAVTELAAASGLTLLSAAERDPMKTTTFGFGEMIRDAVRAGCRSFLLGIGGSATNDGGTGMLRALGFRFLDRNGNSVPEGAAGLAAIAAIDCSGGLPELSECTFRVACDVENPLCGENGCSRVFAPQKGADHESAGIMDAAMEHYAAVVRSVYPGADPDAKGAGAAGGVGFALQNMLHAECEPGIGLVIRMTGLGEAIRQADLVVTGEGCLDAQTAMGKAPAGIAAAAKRYGKPVIAFSGIVREGADACNACGIDAFFPVLRSICTAEEALRPENAAAALTDTAEQAGRLIRLWAKN